MTINGILFSLALLVINVMIECKNSAQEQISKAVLQYTNEFRIQQKLLPVVWHQALADQAREHSHNMAIAKVPFGHHGFQNRIQQLLQRPQAASENLFMCYNMHRDIAHLAVDGWIRSPGHLHNLVGNYTHCGIGIYQNKNGTWFVTQIFALF